MTRLAKNHDAPTLHRTGENYIPPRTHNPIEAARRHERAGTGALIIELQQLGIENALQILQLIEDPNERARAAKFIGGTLLSTAQELFDEDPNIRLRHTLRLPQIADLEGWREDPTEYEFKTFQLLQRAALSSAELASSKAEKQATYKMSQDTARAVGNAGLQLAMFPLPRLAAESSAKDLQLIVRESALDMQNGAIRLSEKIGTNPTIAQFADAYSPLVVELHRNYSPEIVEATQEALRLAS